MPADVLLRPCYSVDELGRVYNRHFSGTGVTEPDASFQYDQGANALGRLSSEWRGVSGNSLSPVYDNWGRVTSASQTIADSTATTSFSYGWDGRILSITYPTGEVAAYGYNARIKSRILCRSQMQ